MKKHSDFIKKIINEVLSYFDIIKEYNVCVFMTGSFARCSNKKNSDIDLHFAYSKKYKNKIFKYEEMIYYIIFAILELNRSNIHSMLVTRLSRDNINLLSEILDNNELLVTLDSRIGKISYKYSANTKRRVYLQYGNDNSLTNIFKYLKYEVEHNNKEWAHIFYVFTQTEKFASYYDKMYEYEKKLINKERIDYRIYRIKEKINEINKAILTIDKTNISQIKLIYQKREFALLNEYISYKRDITLFEHKEWKYINFFDNQIYLNKDYIFEYILDYFFKIFEFAEPLGSDYSLHSNKKSNIECYEDLEKIINCINNKLLLAFNDI